MVAISELTVNRESLIQEGREKIRFYPSSPKAWILGIVAAERHVNLQDGRISFYSGNEHLLKAFRVIGEDVFMSPASLVPKSRQEDGKEYKEVGFSAPFYASALGDLRRDEWFKTVKTRHQWIFESEKNIWNFLEGFFQAHGKVGTKLYQRNILLRTGNPQAAKFLQELLQKVGLQAKIRQKTKTTISGVGIGKIADIKMFAQHVHSQIPEEEEKLQFYRNYGEAEEGLSLKEILQEWEWTKSLLEAGAKEEQVEKKVKTEPLTVFEAKSELDSTEEEPVSGLSAEDEEITADAFAVKNRNLHITNLIDLLLFDNLKTDSAANWELYRSEIATLPLLEQEEEMVVTKRLHEAKTAMAKELYEATRNTLVEANLRFVMHVARGYLGRGLDLEDLIQEGNIGLIRATETFNYKKGYRFLTYAAWWINRFMKEAIAKSRTISLTSGALSEISQLNRHTELFLQEHERIPTPEELANSAGKKLRRVQLLQRCQKPLSLDRPIQVVNNGRESNSVLGSLIPESDDLIGHALEKVDSEMLFLKIMGNSFLDLRQKLALVFYLGLNCEREYSLVEIGKVLGVSNRRVHQLKKQALEDKQIQELFNSSRPVFP